MKIEDIEKILPIRVKDIEVDATSVIEHHFFERGSRHGDYRTESIDFMVKNKIAFHSTCNSAYQAIGKYIVVKCPTCHKNMKSGTGSGSSSQNTMNYSCDCGTEASLTIPSDGLSFRFKEE